jgi:hypothetical protein
LGINQWSLIPKIDKLIDRKKIKLLVPKILKEEWKRNKSKIYNQLHKKTNNAKEDLLFILSMVNLINNDKQKNQEIIKIISDIDPKALATQLSSNYSNGIEKIIDHENSIQLDISDKSKIFAATHALEKKAPFHKNNMSMADALMFFNILDWAEEYKVPKILFVSTNVGDFSQNKQENRESLHSDLQALAKLKEIEIDYFIDIVEVLRNIEDSNITENEVIIGKTVSRIILFKNYLNHSLDQTTINQVKLEIEKLEKQLRSPIEEIQEHQRQLEKSLRSPIEGIQEQQRRLEEQSRSLAEGIQEHQRQLEKNLRSPIEGIQEQQRRLEKSLRSPIEGIQEQQRRLEKNLRSPIEGIQEQQRRLEEQSRSLAEEIQEQQRQ